MSAHGVDGPAYGTVPPALLPPRAPPSRCGVRPGRAGDVHTCCAACAVPGCRAYFSGSTLAALSRQLLRALVFLHELKITHCDLKPENVCIVSASRREFKVSKRMR